MITLEYEVYGEKQLSRAIRGVIDRTTNLTPFWEKSVAPAVFKSCRANFTAGGRPAWAPLRPATQAQRRRQGYGAAAPILKRTGALMKSVTKAGDPNNVLRISPLKFQMFSMLTVGEYLFLAEIHQHGAPSVKIPARAIYALQEQERDKIFQGMYKYLLEGAKTSA